MKNNNIITEIKNYIISRKQYFLLPIFLLLLFPLALANAPNIDIDSPFEHYADDSGYTAKTGYRFTLSEDRTLISVNVDTAATELTRAYILDSSKNNLYNASINSFVANFNVDLNANTTYYIAFDRDGASYSLRRNLTTVYPQERRFVTYTGGLRQSAGVSQDTTDFGFNLDFMTFSPSEGIAYHSFDDGLNFTYVKLYNLTQGKEYKVTIDNLIDTYSNQPFEVFDIYDDFEDGIIDTSLFTCGTLCNETFESGKLYVKVLEAGSNDQRRPIYTNTPINNPHMVSLVEFFDLNAVSQTTNVVGFVEDATLLTDPTSDDTYSLFRIQNQNNINGGLDRLLFTNINNGVSSYSQFQNDFSPNDFCPGAANGDCPLSTYYLKLNSTNFTAYTQLNDMGEIQGENNIDSPLRFTVSHFGTVVNAYILISELGIYENQEELLNLSCSDTTCTFTPNQDVENLVLEIPNTNQNQSLNVTFEEVIPPSIIPNGSIVLLPGQSFSYELNQTYNVTTATGNGDLYFIDSSDGLSDDGTFNIYTRNADNDITNFAAEVTSPDCPQVLPGMAIPGFFNSGVPTDGYFCHYDEDTVEVVWARINQSLSDNTQLVFEYVRPSSGLPMVPPSGVNITLPNQSYTLNSTGVDIPFEYSAATSPYTVYYDVSFFNGAISRNVRLNTTLTSFVEPVTSADVVISDDYSIVVVSRDQDGENTSTSNYTINLCINNWVRNNATCVDDLRNVSYYDSNLCTEQYDIPDDNGTQEVCDDGFLSDEQLNNDQSQFYTNLMVLLLAIVGFATAIIISWTSKNVVVTLFAFLLTAFGTIFVLNNSPEEFKLVYALLGSAVAIFVLVSGFKREN